MSAATLSSSCRCWYRRSSAATRNATLLRSRCLFSTTCDDSILVRKDDKETGITTLTLNNPKRYNVLSWNMLDKLQYHIDDIKVKDTVRSIGVVVIESSSKHAFSSGHDLKEIQSHQSIDETVELFNKCSKFMISINRLPQPVIAKVQGVATAAGCQLVASCDLAVASTNARFGVSGINVGLFCSTPAVALSRCVQRKQAMQMLLTGDLITAEKALSFGLINEVVDPSQLDIKTTELAERIAKQSRFGIQLGKRLFYDQLECNNLEDAYALGVKCMTTNLQHPDVTQGIDDFVNKKK